MRDRMNRLVAVSIATMATSWLLAEGVAHAADPTKAECLAASSASLQSAADHKLRLERSQLFVCASTTCPAVVRKECLSRIDEVSAQIPTIVFEVKDGGGNELSAVKVTMDGEVVAEHLDGSALPLDPGNHKLTFEAAGQPTTTQQILLHEGDKNRHVGVTLASSTAQPAPAPVAIVPVTPPMASIPPSAAPAPASPALDSTSTSPSDGKGHGRRVLGVVVGSVGVAGVVVGGVFGGLGFSSWSSASSACPTNNHCSTTAANDRTSAVTYATVSDVGFIAGGILVAAGVTLYLTAPKDKAPTAGLQITPGGFSVAGRF